MGDYGTVSAADRPQTETDHPAARGARGRIYYGPDTDPNQAQALINRRINHLIAVIALAVCLAVGLTIWSGIRQDNITRSENLSLANAAISTDRAALVRILNDYSTWDEAYENIVLSPDETWWNDNFQNDLLDNFGVTTAIVYNPRDGISLYRAFGGHELLDPKLFMGPEISEFLNAVRAQYGTATGSKSAFVGLGDVIYMVAGKVVQPFDEALKPDPDTVLYEGSVLVFLRPVDQSLIDRISTNFLLPGLHMHPPGQGDTNSLMMPLRAPSGAELMHLGWYPDWPSKALLTFVVPPIVFIIIGIFFLARYATSALWRGTEEIIRSRDEAFAAERSKTSLLANVSHELRTPLNGIIGFSQLLLGGDIKGRELQEYAQAINQSGNHLLAVIEDVLSMSQLDMGVLKIHESLFDIVNCARSVINLLSLGAQTSEIELKLISQGGPLIFQGDEAKIRQVITNLVANAVKFSPPGEMVTVRIVEDSDALQIHVCDQGIGIGAEDIAKVMLPFGQVENTLARRYQGTGLGLPISRSLVELHQGTLKIESEPNIGTTVIVSLPVDRSDGKPAQRLETGADTDSEPQIKVSAA